MTYMIYPYKMGSESARMLRNRLRERGYKAYLRRYDSQRPFSRRHKYIQWGKLPYPPHNYIHLLNYNAGEVTNKLRLLHDLTDAGVSCPEYTTRFDIAQQWATDGPVMARTHLHAHSGIGAHYCERGEPLMQSYDGVRVQLWTKYIKKHHEYRVHVFNGRVIDVQLKKRKLDVPTEEVDYQIRSHSKGWIFAREGIDPPKDVLTQAIASLAATGLDFGAVDVVYNSRDEQAYVLEINSAPGLHGSTVDYYIDAIIGRV